MCKAESNKFIVTLLSHEIWSQTAPGNVYPKLNVKTHSLEILQLNCDEEQTKT